MEAFLMSAQKSKLILSITYVCHTHIRTHAYIRTYTLHRRMYIRMYVCTYIEFLLHGLQSVLGAGHGGPCVAILAGHIQHLLIKGPARQVTQQARMMQEHNTQQTTLNLRHQHSSSVTHVCTFTPAHTLQHPCTHHIYYPHLFVTLFPDLSEHFWSELTVTHSLAHHLYLLLQQTMGLHRHTTSQHTTTA